MTPALTPGQASALRLDTIRRQSAELTPSQRHELERAAANKLGVVELQDARRGLRRAGWERMMERLAALGLCRRYVHGGYEITDAGRMALTWKE